ncbi:MAG: glycosyltransferase family 4 protein [Firmicutes bacterium]|nr:glycosyltransferase family 4 protein [Bacillota bacterium]
MLGQKHIRYREGGVEVVVAELSTRMVQLGHHVTCYDRGGHHVSGKGYDSEKKSVYHGVVVKQVFTINKKGLAAFSSAFSAAVQASFSNADVVHFHAEGPCVMMWLPKLFGKCCICTIHGIDWQRAKWRGMAKKVIHYGEKVAAREADEIIVLSKSAQDYFWNTYHRKTVLLPNGIDPAEPVPVREIQKQYGLAKGQYILFLGRIVPEKGIHYLIQAFRQIRTDKKLVIAGGASDTASYFEEVKKQAEGDDRILFTGFVSGRPMQELYSNAYLYVLPSDLEGMPLTILEAMSYGDCCVVSDIPECADVVGDAGVTFRHGDAKDLQNVLERCFDDPELTRHLGDLARERVKACYDWDEITRRTIGVYRGTLDVVSEKDAIRRMERE